MWDVNIKILIVIIFCNTVICQVRQYNGHPGGIMFPGPIGPVYNEKKRYNTIPNESCRDCQNAIPRSLELAAELNELDSYEDFIKFIESKTGTKRDLLLSTRSGFENERSNAVVPQPGKCKPQLQLIEFNYNNDPFTIYYPSCTRVNRCGGCCNTSLWSCQPIERNMTNFKILKSTLNKYDPEHNSVREEIIPIEEHLNCQCLCKLKAENCTIKQKYFEKQCACQCINTDEQEKCENSGEIKRWDSSNCECSCRKEEECNSGLYFDTNTCRCIKIVNTRIGQDNYYNRQSSGDNQYTRRPHVSVFTTPSPIDPRRKHKDQE